MHDLAPSVSALADPEHLEFATCGILLRNKAKPRGHVAGFFELLTVASSCEHRSGAQRAYTWLPVKKPV